MRGKACDKDELTLVTLARLAWREGAGVMVVEEALEGARGSCLRDCSGCCDARDATLADCNCEMIGCDSDVDEGNL